MHQSLRYRLETKTNRQQTNPNRTKSGGCQNTLYEAPVASPYTGHGGTFPLIIYKNVDRPNYRPNCTLMRRYCQRHIKQVYVGSHYCRSEFQNVHWPRRMLPLASHGKMFSFLYHASWRPEQLA